MAVQSKAFAAGNRAMTIKGGVAVIAHQASANPMYGSVGLELLAAGMAPQQALDFMVRADDGRDNRQVAILDIQGRSAAWTGRARTTGRAIVRRQLLCPGQHPGWGSDGRGLRNRSNRQRVRWPNG